MQIEDQPLHLNPDGSINTALYAARGRRMRAEQAHRLGGSLFRLPARLIAGLFALPWRAARRMTLRQPGRTAP